MWLLHARSVWSGLIVEHCSLPLLMPDKQHATIPGFNAGLKQERLKSWDSAYPPLWGSSHSARSISEKSLILDSYPGYLLTELLHTCLHWKKIIFCPSEYTLSKLCLLLRKHLPLFDLCVSNCLPKLWMVPVTFILHAYFTALNSFSCWDWNSSLPPTLSVPSCQ